jgi:sirohydrochlorin ferrochelatase
MEIQARVMEAVVQLLEQASERREQASRARRLAESISRKDVVENLSCYAATLEMKACALEKRAADIAQTVPGSSRNEENLV